MAVAEIAGVTPLESIIREMIATEGPMPLDRYIALCLGHPVHGYYMAREAFGEEGDFITAPEISQVFGELVGIWCVAAWQAMGAPVCFNLVELGPGRGTLMSDILRAGKVSPEFLGAAKVNLVETSQRLRQMQKQKVADATWHDTLADVPDGPMVLVANEFFDALPIRQFELGRGHRFERCVGLKGDALAMGLVNSGVFLPSPLAAEGGANAPGEGVSERTFIPRFAGPSPARGEGDSAVIEWSDVRSKVAEEIGARLNRHAGAALIIDYGHFISVPGDTLQAVRKHKHVPITHAPGECDLTSHVDFEALTNALRQAGAIVWAGLTQRTFLLAMGIETRTAALSARADRAAADVLKRAMARLVDESEMGNLFKVMAATSPGLPTPYPFGPS